MGKMNMCSENPHRKKAARFLSWVIIPDFSSHSSVAEEIQKYPTRFSF
jgi:hypothetical protein